MSTLNTCNDKQRSDLMSPGLALRKNHDWTKDPFLPTLTPFQKLIRNVDWQSSQLGPMDAWPPQLRQIVLQVVADPSPAFVTWGEEMTVIYNEAFAPHIGKKHPWAQGRCPKAVFADAWSQFDRILEGVQQSGETVLDRRQLILLDKDGFLEETYFSWKFVPVIGQEGTVIATYATIGEVTREVLSERRIQTIRALSEQMTTSNDIKEVWARLLSGLESNDKDIPMALLYSVKQVSSVSNFNRHIRRDSFTTSICALEGTLGIQPGHPGAPTQMQLEDSTLGFVGAFRESMKGEGPLLLRLGENGLSESLFTDIDWRGFGVPCDEIVVCPIRSNPSRKLMGFYLLALNPRRQYDESFRDFIHLVTDQITTPHVSAVLLSEEIKQSRSAAAQAAIERAELSKQLLARTLDFEQSEMRFSRFADRAAAALGIMDPEGYIIYANETWYDLLSLHPVDNKPLSFMDGIIEEDVDKVMTMWHQLCLNQSVKLQVRFKKPWTGTTPHGGTMYSPFTTGIATAYPDMNDDGTVKSVMACIMDISELQWNEDQVRIRTRELEQSELKYKQFADHAPIGVALIDPEGRMEFANDAWFAITSQSRQEQRTGIWLDAIHPEDVAKMESAFAMLLACKNPITIECRLKRSGRPAGGQCGLDEDPAWILASAYPELTSDGSVKNVVCWFTDISAQKAAERDLRIRMDEALETKRQQENFIDMTSHEIRNPLSAVLNCTEEIISSVSEYNTRPGTPASPNQTSFRTSSNNVSGKLRGLLENVMDSAQTIAYCVHHQKRIVDDILTLSKMDSSLLTISPIPVQPIKVAQDALKIFQGELRAADTILEFREDSSLRDLKVDWVLLDPSRVRQVLINLTTNAIKFTRSEERRHITVTIAASLEKPSERDDGVEYVPPKTEQKEAVFHRDWPSEETLYLSYAVQDTGRGLSQEEKKNLFHRFSQASPKTHVEYGGSGLGLFISRQLTEMQGGEIGVATESGNGCRFVFFIKTRKTMPPENCFFSTPPPSPMKNLFPPAVNGAHVSYPARAENQPRANMATTLGPVRRRPTASFDILIVEDNLVNQKILSKQLRSRGCLVEVANHGQEALAALERTSSWRGSESARRFDAILMDLEMPIMNGITCVGKIRELEASGCLLGRVPVIAVTANVRNEHVKAALAAGMDDVVTKPYGIDDILIQIDRACSQTRQTPVQVVVA